MERRPADLPVGDYGWGLVKLEPLFGPAGQRFMVCDVDTIFTGRVLDVRAKSDAPFFVDDEQLSDADFKRLYYDWDALTQIDPDAQSARKSFNVGQWFGTAGLVDRCRIQSMGRMDLATPASLSGPLHGWRPGRDELRAS